MTEADDWLALERLILYAEQFEPTQVIDDVSGLTGNDLDLVIALAQRGAKTVSIQSIDLTDMHNLTD